MKDVGKHVQPQRIPETCRCGGVEAKNYHRHSDGTHWCNRCERYCGASGDYGSDMADEHPAPCQCPPCPVEGHFCYGLGFYNHVAAQRMAVSRGRVDA